MTKQFTNLLQAIKEKEPWAIHTSLLFLLCGILWSPWGVHLAPTGAIELQWLPLVRISLTGLLIIFLQSSYLLYLHFSKRKFKDYRFNVKANCWIKNSTDRICPKCKVENKLSRLGLDSGKDIFVCSCCEHKSKNIAPRVMSMSKGFIVEE